MEEPGERELEPRQLQALAHPLRIALLNALREAGAATATQLARQLGVNSGAASYHLRQLAAYGFVREDPARAGNQRIGRERWWEPTFRAHRINPASFVDDPTLRGALDMYLHEVLNRHFRRTAEWLAAQTEWSPEWAAAATFSEHQVRLTPDRLQELVKELDDVIAGYLDDPDGEPVVVGFQAFPRVTEADGA